MKIAVLADIHSNLEALRTCVRYALEREVDRFIFLGDYLGELAFPQRTMEYLYRLRDSYPCVFIRGNKEDYWLEHRSAEEDSWRKHDSTTGSLYYTYGELGKKDFDFFASMKIAEVMRFDGQEPFTVCHGSPRRVNEGLHPDKQNTVEIMEQSSTRLILCGHTHTRRKIEHNGKTVINPGAVGLPFGSGGKAQFMILHGEQGGWKEEFVSLSYDVEKEIEDLYEAGLDRLAPYWCKTTIQCLRAGKYHHSHVLQKAMQLCREGEGECIWPRIPEKYWEKAYETFFGQEDLQSYACNKPEKEDFPVRLESRAIYESAWLTLYADKVKMPGGNVINAYHRVHVPKESVCVVIRNEKRQYLLIQSKRYTTGRLEWEIPAGRIESGECAEDAAKRECLEETGCEIKEVGYLCSQNPANGISDILIHYYLAKVSGESAGFDENEVKGKRWVSEEEVRIMLRNNGSRCGVSMFGLLYVLNFEGSAKVSRHK